jgi:predicted transposase/invertase (TIGR01784 family)
LSRTYDKTIRSLLKELPTTFMELITGKKLSKESLKPLDIKLQKVIEREADLIVENTETGEIYHVEFQSTNDSSMPVRMALYFYLILQNYGKAPKQYLVFVGKGECTMPSSVEIGSSKHSYKVVDLKRDVDCQKLLESDNPNDWIFTVLCRLDPQKTAIRTAIQKIKNIEDKRLQQELIQKLFILAGLREEQILKLVEQEVKSMGLVIDPETNLYLKEIKEQGRLEGKLESAKKFYLELHLSPERIARILDLPLELVKEAIREAEEENK